MALVSLIRVSVAIIAISVLSGKGATAQAKRQVTFHVGGFTTSGPVQVVGIKIGDGSVALDEPVTVGSHWLRDFSIELQNVSTKTIISVGALLVYPETGNNTSQSHTITTPLGVGRRPDHALLNKDGWLNPRRPEETDPPVAIQPGGAMTIKVGAKLADLSLATASEAAGGAITQVTIQPDAIYFSDESFWYADRYFVPEPAPERYRPASADDFRKKCDSAVTSIATVEE
jgi:hypothetical protein